MKPIHGKLVISNRRFALALIGQVMDVSNVRGILVNR